MIEIVINPVNQMMYDLYVTGDSTVEIVLNPHAPTHIVERKTGDHYRACFLKVGESGMLATVPIKIAKQVTNMNGNTHS